MAGLNMFVACFSRNTVSFEERTQVSAFVSHSDAPSGADAISPDEALSLGYVLRFQTYPLDDAHGGTTSQRATV
jgi:hypothetical protein